MSKVVVVLICLGVAMVLFKAASGLAGTGAKPGAGWVFRLAGMAAALLGSVPVAVIYSFFVDYYVAGLTAGSVKN